MKTYYKIADRNPNGTIRTLFHGVKGVRKIPKGKWMESERKWVNDASGPFYWSGWHVLPTKKVAQEYLTRFTTRLNRLVILPCHIKGKVWRKPHAREPVLLAQWMKLIPKRKKRKPVEPTYVMRYGIDNYQPDDWKDW